MQHDQLLIEKSPSDISLATSRILHFLNSIETCCWGDEQLPVGTTSIDVETSTMNVDQLPKIECLGFSRCKRLP